MPRAIVAHSPDRPARTRGALAWMARGTARKVVDFARDEGGSVTVESVLWLPFFFALLLLITEVSLAFYGKAQVFRIVQNANRGYSVARTNLDTEAEVEAWVRRRLKTFSPTANVDTWTRNGVIGTRVVIPASDLMLFGGFGVLTGLTITVQSAIYDEVP